MVIPGTLAPELKVCNLHPYVSPQRKQSIFLVSIQTLCLPSLWLRIFISGTQSSFKPPNFTYSCSVDPSCPSWGKEGEPTLLLPFSGPLPGKWPCDWVLVCSLWQHWAKRWHLEWLFSASFPAPMPGSSATFRHPYSSCDPGDPETMLSHIVFHPTLSPEHL